MINLLIMYVHMKANYGRKHFSLWDILIPGYMLYMSSELQLSLNGAKPLSMCTYS